MTEFPRLFTADNFYPAHIKPVTGIGAENHHRAKQEKRRRNAGLFPRFRLSGKDRKETEAQIKGAENRGKRAPIPMAVAGDRIVLMPGRYRKHRKSRKKQSPARRLFSALPERTAVSADAARKKSQRAQRQKEPHRSQKGHAPLGERRHNQPVENIQKSRSFFRSGRNGKSKHPFDTLLIKITGRTGKIDWKEDCGKGKHRPAKSKKAKGKPFSPAIPAGPRRKEKRKGETDQHPQ